MTDNDLHQYLLDVRGKMRVTKVVATRAVKGARGDSFAGFAAAWESVQDDNGGKGAELLDTMDEPVAAQGMTLKEARVAHLMLALEADVAATEAAMAGGNISFEDGDNRIRMYKNNYAKLIRRATGNASEKVIEDATSDGDSE